MLQEKYILHQFWRVNVQKTISQSQRADRVLDQTASFMFLKGRQRWSGDGRRSIEQDSDLLSTGAVSLYRKLNCVGFLSINICLAAFSLCQTQTTRTNEEQEQMNVDYFSSRWTTNYIFLWREQIVMIFFMSQECPCLCNVQYHSVKFMVLKYVGADCALVSRQQRTVSLSASESTAARTTNNTNETGNCIYVVSCSDRFSPKNERCSAHLQTCL